MDRENSIHHLPLLIIIGAALAIAGVTYYKVYNSVHSPLPTLSTAPAPQTSGIQSKNNNLIDIDITAAGIIQIRFADGKIVTIPKDLINDAGNQVGSQSPKISADKKTAGWLATYPNCCTSYPVPMTLVLYKDSKIIQKIESQQVIWDWAFVDDGTQAAIINGPTHGTDEDMEYQLYDVLTGKLLAEVQDPITSSSPKWVDGLTLDQVMEYQRYD